ncbi:MAG: hypothetical protein KGO02_17925 [Alphaproteobacteria bacterium]|nr:hypothetical protein [Alphaproteobacteria bacterium]
MNPIIDLIACAAIGIAIGVGVGIYTRGEHDTAKQVRQVIANQRATAQQIVQSTQESQKLTASISARDAAVDADKQAAHERVVTQIRYIYKEKQSDAATQDCGPAYLDLGTVRLLNAARAGRTLGSASGSNGKGAAATSTSGSN